MSIPAHGGTLVNRIREGAQAERLREQAAGLKEVVLALREQCDDTLAGFMLTNPNTLGLFE